MTEHRNRRDSTKGERELLRRLRAELFGGEQAPSLHGRNQAVGSPSSGTVQFGDDMAALDPRDPTLLWTADMLMDGVDFDSRRHDWHAIGRKAMAVNLSDCAAMAARPVAALCAVALQDTVSMDDALALFRGVREMGAAFGCPVVGGDTNSWAAPTVVSVTVAGRTVAGGPVPRNGARPGDHIFVTGPLGGSILGRHMTFTPRIETAATLAGACRPHAMIDLSDGLSVDLGHVLDESGCAAELDAAALEPAIHDDARALAARDGVAAIDHALSDGEDFELVVVLAADAPRDAIGRLGLIPLGRIIAGAGEIWRCEPDGSRVSIPRRGWEHFR